MTSRSFSRSVPANLTTSIRAAILAAAGVVVCSVPGAMADIVGFQPGSFELNRADSGNLPQLIGGGTGVQITTGSSAQTRSLWFYEQQQISQFNVQFTFRATGGTGSTSPDILSFVVQRDVDGVEAIGFANISPSVSVTTEFRGIGAVGTRSGVYLNGVFGGGSDSTSPVNVVQGNPVRINITYDGSLLTRSYTDLVSGATWTSSPSLIGSISSIVGGQSAFVGFSADAVGGSQWNMFITDFSYTVPSPSTAALLGLGGLMAARRRR